MDRRKPTLAIARLHAQDFASAVDTIQFLQKSPRRTVDFIRAYIQNLFLAHAQGMMGQMDAVHNLLQQTLPITDPSIQKLYKCLKLRFDSGDCYNLSLEDVPSDLDACIFDQECFLGVQLSLER